MSMDLSVLLLYVVLLSEIEFDGMLVFIRHGFARFLASQTLFVENRQGAMTEIFELPSLFPCLHVLQYTTLGSFPCNEASNA